MNVRIVSPAGSIDPAVILKGKNTIESWGWTAQVAPHAQNQYGRYAGTPSERVSDILEALNDASVDAIWCARGGYGCMQILDQIPTNLIKQHPKWLIGYSDITALHALWLKAGVPSLHAPMLKHLGEDALHPVTAHVKQLLETYSSPLMVLNETTPMETPTLTLPTHPLNVTGTVQGRLVGGNLAVLSGLHGTPYDFEYHDSILFIEDIAESPYKIDRMMQTLKLQGALHQIKGLIVGQFTDCKEDPMMGCTIYENIASMVRPLGIPVIFDAPIGHVTNNEPMIEGSMYQMIVGTEATSISLKNNSKY